MRNRVVLLLLLAMMATAVGALESPSGTDEPLSLDINEAWVRTPPPGARMLAGYALMHNRGEEDISLTAVSSEPFGMAEIHQSYQDGDRMRMRHVPKLTIPAGESVLLEPGGLHIMLMRPKTSLEDGQSITIRFQADDGRSIDAQFQVRREAP